MRSWSAEWSFVTTVIEQRPFPNFNVMDPVTSSSPTVWRGQWSLLGCAQTFLSRPESVRRVHARPGGPSLPLHLHLYPVTLRLGGKF